MLKGGTILVLLITILYFNTLYLKVNCQEIIEEDELIAIQKQRISPQQIEKALLKRNVYFKNIINIEESNLSFSILKVARGENTKNIVNDLKKSGLFELIEPNYKLNPDYEVVSIQNRKIIPNDKDFKRQYYLEQIKVPKAWLFSMGSPIVPIAVLDSGIDYSNLDLIERILPCATFVENSFSCQDTFGHGTQIASIIGAKADNNYELAGISWINPILPIKVGNERGIATVATLIKGLEHAIKSGAKIAVISLSTKEESEALKLAIKTTYQKGILIIASGGNLGTEEVVYPAGFDDVIGVGSVNSTEEKSSFSNSGLHIKIVAPGENILVPSINSNFLLEVNGTSFSAPQIAGVAALVWALRPSYNNEDIKNVLLSSTNDLGASGYDTVFGYGQIDAELAVKTVLEKLKK